MVMWNCVACHVGARMHYKANGTMELGVVRMGEEPGRKTSILDHGLIKFLAVFF
jgi:hypothetical protein